MAYERLALVAEFFPDFDRWLRNSPRRSRYMDAAEEALQGVSPEAIGKACRKLLEGDLPRHQRLPFLVAQLAKQVESGKDAAKWRAISEGQATVRCRLCNDTGLVEILDPATVKERRETGKLIVPYTCVVLCTCPAGDRRAEISGALKLRRLRGNDITRDHQLSAREQYETLNRV